MFIATAQQQGIQKKSGKEKKKKKKKTEKEQPVAYSLLWKDILNGMTYLNTASL